MGDLARSAPSGYLAPDDYSDMEDQTRGEYPGGLGLEVASDEGAVKIDPRRSTTPRRRAPACESGDYIHLDRRQASLIRPTVIRRGQEDARHGRAADHADHRAARQGSVRRPPGPRVDQHQVGQGPHGRRLRLPARLGLRREDHGRGRGHDQGPVQASGRTRTDQGLGAGLAQQSGRPARPGGPRSPACSSTAARWCPSAAAIRRTSSATTPAPTATC